MLDVASPPRVSSTTSTGPPGSPTWTGQDRTGHGDVATEADQHVDAQPVRDGLCSPVGCPRLCGRTEVEVDVGQVDDITVQAHLSPSSGRTRGRGRPVGRKGGERPVVPSRHQRTAEGRVDEAIGPLRRRQRNLKGPG